MQKRGAYSDVSVDLILCSNSVGSKQMDGFNRGEGRVLHTRKDGVGGVEWLWNQIVRGRLRVVGTASKELETRSAKAVRGSHGTGELNARVNRVQNGYVDERQAIEVRTSHRRKLDAPKRTG